MTTTHYGLEKPVKATDSALISAINGNMEILDGVLNELSEAVAVVQRTDTATQNIGTGELVLWKGELHKATSDIALGDTLSASNLVEITDGGLNETAQTEFETKEATATYTIGSNKEIYKEIEIPAETLGRKEVYGLAGFETGSASAAFVNCFISKSQYTQKYKIYIDLRNLAYPDNVSGSKTLKIKYFIA